MIIHVINRGDTLYSIGEKYNVDYKQIALNNQISLNDSLVIGDTLVIVIDNTRKKYRKIEVNGFTYPNITDNLLNEWLPSLTYLSIFSYSFNINGSLNEINDESLIDKAINNEVLPIMVLTNIGIERRFDSELLKTILNDEEVQNILINNILSTINKKRYVGLNVDFEYVYPEDKIKYINFIIKLRDELHKYDYLFSVSLAPKTSDEQEGILYEAHDYKEIGKIADFVVLMTYEWGYSGGPARAVAPLNLVSKVLDYAVTTIPSEKIMLGIPNYGYDWTLPYKEGTLAKSIGNVESVKLARENNQFINYDYISSTPYFNYSNNEDHQVWFENSLSIKDKLDLVLKYNLKGISYWTINRIFPQNQLVLNSMYELVKFTY